MSAITKNRSGLASRRSRARAGGSLLKTSSPIISISLLFVTAVLLFSILGKGFLSPFNLNSLTQLAAQDIVIGLAQTVMIVLGRMNLAVGGIAALVGAVFGSLAERGIPIPTLIVIALIVGALAGGLMAIAELATGLNAFIVTLAFLSIYSGAVIVATEAHHYRIPSPEFIKFGNGSLFTPHLSMLMLVAGIVAVGMWLFYFRTPFGWKAVAIGANEKAAVASTVHRKRTVALGYVISGVLCAIAALMEIARVGEASPALGSAWLFPSFIGPVLGGVALTGGVVTIAGVVLAALFYDTLASGLVLIGVPTYWLEFAQGLILLGALILIEMRTGMFRKLLRRLNLRQGASDGKTS